MVNSMPYRDPERKRQWEREHREQRNARRRALRLTVQTVVNPKTAPDPVPNQQHTNGWKMFAGLAIALCISLVAAIVGPNLPGSIIGGGPKFPEPPTSFR